MLSCLTKPTTKQNKHNLICACLLCFVVVDAELLNKTNNKTKQTQSNLCLLACFVVVDAELLNKTNNKTKQTQSNLCLLALLLFSCCKTATNRNWKIWITIYPPTIYSTKINDKPPGLPSRTSQSYACQCHHICRSNGPWSLICQSTWPITTELNKIH